MVVSDTLVKRVKREYSKYGLNDNLTVADLQEDILSVCQVTATSKDKFLKCLDDGSKVVRKKLNQLRKTVFADRLNDPVDESIIQEVIDHLNEIVSPNGEGIGNLKRKLVLACAEVSKTVDDLLTCIDEGEKIPLIINKDLYKLL